MRTQTEPGPFNYSFLLQCMGALAVTAAITLGIAAAMTSQAGTILATGLAAKTLFAASVTTAIAFPAIILPIALIVAVGAICLLPFLFGGSRSYTSVPTMGYPYYGPGYFSSPPAFGGGYGSYSNRHHHHHYSPAVAIYDQGASQHHHGDSTHSHGQVHQHGGSSHYHGHS